jgi:hypothetical protein
MVLASVFVAAPAVASTITYEYLSVSGDGGPQAGISYKLVVDDGTGEVTFTVGGSSAEAASWAAGWFAFKFIEGSTPGNITALTSTPAGTGAWSYADIDTNTAVTVLKANNGYGTLLNASEVGLYLTSLSPAGAPANPMNGVCLVGTCGLDLPATFEFTMALPAGWERAEIPFQVGFYSPKTNSTKFIVNRLSRTLDETHQVPDSGTTIWLMGFVMIVLEVGRRMSRI